MEAIHSLRLERRRMIQMITCREWGEEKKSENVANKFALTATLKVVLFRVLNKVLYRERWPEVQPLPLLYTIFDRKGTPFVYVLLTNGTTFIYLVIIRTLHPF